MRLEPAEVRELAAFLAKRFPAAEDRARFARAVELAPPRADGPVEGWEGLLELAQSFGRLGRLAGALTAAAPGDENLAAACRELGGAERRGGVLRVAVGLAAVAAVSAMIGVWGVSYLGDSPESAAVAASPVHRVPAGVAEPLVAPVAPAVAPVVAAEPAVAEVATVAASVEPAVAPVVAAVVASARPSVDRAGCSGVTGDVVGWWYAGGASPGPVGTELTMDRGARVRADYPRVDNRHDARAPERCVLEAGDHLRITHAPIETSKGHWWVPYAVGDGG